MALAAVEGGATTFRREGFLHSYPTKESRPSSPGFGYGSDMMAIAVNRDDAAAFMFFLDECGGPEVEVFIAGNIFNYAALHGATKCLHALFKSGAKSNYPIEHWLQRAERPSYGPRADKSL